jgi:hypothetical protein
MKPMLAVGNGELDNNPNVPEIYQCPRCNQQHKVEYGNKIEKDGSKTPSKTLAYVKCRGKTLFSKEKTYLVGLHGKLLRSA